MVHLSVGLFVAAIIAGTATAQEFSHRKPDGRVLCINRDALVDALKKDSGEFLAGQGLVRGGKRMVELYASTSGSWSVVMTRPDGVSCMISMGTDWSRIGAPEQGTDSAWRVD